MYERTGIAPSDEHTISSRVDMLIAIYDAAIEAVDQVVVALEANKPHETTIARSQAIVLVGLIESGLDLTQGPIPNRIKELCGFVEQTLLKPDPVATRAARKVLKNLRDAFFEIREDANQLEKNGELPKISLGHCVDAVM